MTICPVIMCGGSGTRLWPASRPSRPKQFIPLIGDLSTFQTTVKRLGEIQGASRPLVIAGAGHADWIRRNLAQIGAEADVVLEPEARDSAAAVAAAAAWVEAHRPGAVLAIVAADHQVPDAAAFARAVETAAIAAEGGWIVTLGVKPTYAATAYGYIAPGEAIGDGVLAVGQFVEKPKADRAQALVDQGFFWNSGNFIASAKALTEAFAAYAPEIGAAAQAAVASATAAPTGSTLGWAFSAAPKDSFDYAVMEKTDRAAVLPIDFAWSDLGAWDAIWDAAPKDADGNVISGEARVIDVSDSLVRLTNNGGRSVTVLGLSNVAVIGDDKDLLIASLASSQGVKAAAEQAARPPAPIETRLKAHAANFDRWFRASALPLWWSVGADHKRGGYYDLIGQDGRPVAGPRRARVQARQSFVYAQGALTGAPGDWLPAASHGLAYMRARYRRPDGLFRTSVDDAGLPIDEDAYLYDQAFFLMASATLAGLVDDPAPIRAECEGLLAAIERSLGHEPGGFSEAGPQPFQANAHMHFLEAALAWMEAGGDGRWEALAQKIVDLALRAFIDRDGGFLREFFDGAWRPKAGPDGRLVEPGHQFEWAWLMARWGRLGSDDAKAASSRLFECGAMGVDALRSVAVDELDLLDAVRSPRARLWPQTEYVKAAMILAETDSGDGKRDAYLAHAARAADGLWAYLQTPIQGLWWDKMGEDGAFVNEAAPSSSLYHIVGAINALRPLL